MGVLLIVLHKNQLLILEFFKKRSLSTGMFSITGVINFQFLKLFAFSCVY